ncbi:MAG: hypothetical protein QOI12_5242 [Alphaproteobacteria bacterium]|jgi:hypothetical protein|nr:hypothetical protein [Alphaproteobacteria bacterium]
MDLNVWAIADEAYRPDLNNFVEAYKRWHPPRRKK